MGGSLPCYLAAPRFCHWRDPMYATERSEQVFPQPNECPRCGFAAPAGANFCGTCGYPLVPPTARLPKTGPLNRAPTVVPGANSQPECFKNDDRLVLQFLPSGICATLDMEQPTVLGRGQLPDDALYDLTPYNAVQHGVSRHHCLLRRQDNHLLIADLESLNGTFINGHRLIPRREYVLRDGDRLVLGSLHILVAFH